MVRAIGDAQIAITRQLCDTHVADLGAVAAASVAAGWRLVGRPNRRFALTAPPHDLG